MDKKVIIAILLSVVVILIVLIIYFKIVVRGITVSSTSNISTPTSTTCNISCPPGYEVDPLTCQCSPIVPAGIIPEPNAALNVNLMLDLGLTHPPTSPPFCSEYPSIDKACMGVLPSPTAPSSCYCQNACDPRYGCNPPVAQTSGTVSFYVTVVSSNQTPIPNTKVKVSQNFFPQTFQIGVFGYPLGQPVQVGTVTLTFGSPPTEVTTDSNGRAYITIPFTAKLTSINWAEYYATFPGVGCSGFTPYASDCSSAPLDGVCQGIPTPQFIICIPDSTLCVPVYVPLTINFIQCSE